MNDKRRLTALAGACVVTALVIAFAVAAHAVRADGLSALSTPEATVQSFLSSALVEQNPVTACSYLTPRARTSFERPGGQDCASFIAAARLTVGGRAIVSNRQIDRLTYTVVRARERPDRPRVAQAHVRPAPGLRGRPRRVPRAADRLAHRLERGRAGELVLGAHVLEHGQHAAVLGRLRVGEV